MSRKKIIICSLAGVVVLGLITLLTLFLVNEYSITFNIEDGQTIVMEYGTDDLDVSAVYSGTIFERKGKEVEYSIDGSIDYETLGEYSVTFKATYKKVTKSVAATVVIEDTVAPVIDLATVPGYFTSPVGVYEEEGFTATDNYDGDITALVSRVEDEEKIVYTVQDSSGNETVVTRDIIYKDVIPPVITLNGDADVIVGIGLEYVEPGCTATDECDGDITSSVEITGTVDMNNYGTYPIVYKVQDSAANVTEITRNVKVSDITAPVITLTGGTQYVKRGDTFTDKGYSASDNVDGDISANISVSGSVDTSKEGTYTLTYTVKDGAGNSATATRKVYVYEKQMVADTVNPGNKIVYLTFDDGPGPYTDDLLDILDKYGVKATFFVTGQKSAYYNMIGETYRRGHTIALHTFSHQWSIYSSEETYYADLKKISDLVYQQTGQYSNIVRFPGGTSNGVSRQYCTGIMTTLSQSLSYHGYLYCDWNVSSGDAGGTTSSAQVAANVIAGMKSHNVSIVLQHDIKKFSVDAVEEIVAWGLANGYTFLPMDESTPMVHQRVNN